MIRKCLTSILLGRYPYRRYDVVTDDGYILSVDRIARPSTTRSMLLVHGIMDSSHAWVARRCCVSQNLFKLENNIPVTNPLRIDENGEAPNFPKGPNSKQLHYGKPLFGDFFHTARPLPFCLWWLCHPQGTKQRGRQLSILNRRFVLEMGEFCSFFSLVAEHCAGTKNIACGPISPLRVAFDARRSTAAHGRG